MSTAYHVMRKYPGRVPVVIRPKNDKIPVIDKEKYLVPRDMTVAQFVVIIRKHIKLKSTEAIFIFVNNTLPPNSSTVGDVYDENRDGLDHMLYITYNMENTFG